MWAGIVLATGPQTEPKCQGQEWSTDQVMRPGTCLKTQWLGRVCKVSVGEQDGWRQ